MPILSVESRFIHFLEFTFELIVLNLLTLLCSLPVFTIGVALTALNRSLFDIRQGKGNIIRGFFKAFVDNFRSGLLLGLVFITISISFVLYLILLRDLINAGDVTVWVGIVLIAILFYFPMAFVFPLLAMFDSAALRTFANAFLLSFRHFGVSLVVVLFYVLPWLLVLINPSWFQGLFPIFLMFGLSLPGWISSKFFLKVFRKYAEL